MDKDNHQIHVAVPTPDGLLNATVWRLDVGRVPLFLLDANVMENSHDLRMLTARLYAGDRQTRLRQELLLGIGGFRALIQLGYNPHVCHINEGHAAFLSLERISHLVKTEGLSVEAAMEVASRTGVFTTHTPVPAGNESFKTELLKPHLAALKDDLGITPEQVMSHLTLRPVNQFEFATSRMPANVNQFLIGHCMTTQAVGGNFVNLCRSDLTRSSRGIDSGRFLFSRLTVYIAAGIFAVTL